VFAIVPLFLLPMDALHSKLAQSQLTARPTAAIAIAGERMPSSHQDLCVPTQYRGIESGSCGRVNFAMLGAAHRGLRLRLSTTRRCSCCVAAAQQHSYAAVVIICSLDLIFERVPIA